MLELNNIISFFASTNIVSFYEFIIIISFLLVLLPLIYRVARYCSVKPKNKNEYIPEIAQVRAVSQNDANELKKIGLANWDNDIYFRFYSKGCSYKIKEKYEGKINLDEPHFRFNRRGYFTINQKVIAAKFLKYKILPSSSFSLPRVMYQFYKYHKNLAGNWRGFVLYLIPFFISLIASMLQNQEFVSTPTLVLDTMIYAASLPFVLLYLQTLLQLKNYHQKGKVVSSNVGFSYLHKYYSVVIFMAKFFIIYTPVVLVTAFDNKIIGTILAVIFFLLSLFEIGLTLFMPEKIVLTPMGCEDEVENPIPPLDYKAINKRYHMQQLGLQAIVLILAVTLKFQNHFTVKLGFNLIHNIIFSVIFLLFIMLIAGFRIISQTHEKNYPTIEELVDMFEWQDFYAKYVAEKEAEEAKEQKQKEREEARKQAELDRQKEIQRTKQELKRARIEEENQLILKRIQEKNRKLAEQYGIVTEEMEKEALAKKAEERKRRKDSELELIKKKQKTSQELTAKEGSKLIEEANREKSAVTYANDKSKVDRFSVKR